jgi:predicted lipoprotein with Yx(FWY)xxD motif
MIHSPRRSLVAVALGAAVLLAACGSSGSSASNTTPGSGATTTTGGGYSPYGSSGSTTSAPTSAPPTTVTNAAVVNVVSTSLGLTLVDASGKTLYEFKPDPAGSSTCTGGCAQIWPPLTTTAATVVVGKGLTASLFKTVGSSKIVAIAGHPLYRFSGDAKAGDTKGEGFGGVWHVAGPVGNTM